MRNALHSALHVVGLPEKVTAVMSMLSQRSQTLAGAVGLWKWLLRPRILEQPHREVHRARTRSRWSPLTGELALEGWEGAPESGSPGCG